MSAASSVAARPHRAPGPPPVGVGVGLKPEHADALLAAPGAVRWVEVHAENYMRDGGPAHRMLDAVRRELPVSVHGVGLSLGGAADLDPDHLARLAAVVARHQPALVSEHLAWCGTAGAFLNDLLPVPCTREALDIVVRHVDQTQEALGRTILIENPSRYLAFQGEDMDEPAFLAAVVARTGCGLLLDVNNVHVSACNMGFDPLAYITALPLEAVGEIHLAGHAVRTVDGVEIRIDDHGSAVPDAVLALYAETLRRTGARPTLIERDSNIPPWAELSAEAARVAALMAEVLGETPARAPA